MINKKGNFWIPCKKHKELFAREFPFIPAILTLLKEKNYRNLSVYLQKVESYVFIDCIARELAEAGIIPVTIHDSIVVDKKGELRAVQIMQRVFLLHFNALPVLKVSYMGTGDRTKKLPDEGVADIPKQRPTKIIKKLIEEVACVA